jgi:N-carbamoyl-L-amino-acid hydrolase
MGKIGEKEGLRGITRLALTQEDGEARKLLIKWLEKEEVDVRIDPIGNIFGIRPGTDERAAPVMMGSHLDTVREAGIFDGAAGVLTGLEVIRSLNEGDVETDKRVALACFTNEEGARFQPSMMGSYVYSGQESLEKTMSKIDDDGVSVSQALDDIGFRGKDRVEAGTYLELHVEQGSFLDDSKIDIGIVEGIQGISWWHGVYTGEANHAGTTQISNRRDALLGAAELCCSLREVAIELGHGTVTTMGRLKPKPDIINVIPGEARFTIDMRQFDYSIFQEGKKRVEKKVERVAEKHGLSHKISKVSDVKPVHFNPEMVNLVERKAKTLGLSNMRMPSGAGHDAQLMNYVCPTSMIFIPSKNGRSHCPEEFTSFDAIFKGANVLLNCILELSGVADG